MAKRKKKSSGASQIAFDDIRLRKGDKIFKEGTLYAEVAGESDTLYFLHRSGRESGMPSPYHKRNLIENILLGNFSLETVNYE